MCLNLSISIFSSDCLAGFQCRGERAVVHVIDLSADRHAMRELRRGDIGAAEIVGKVMRRRLAVDRGIEGDDDFPDLRVAGALQQMRDGERGEYRIAAADINPYIALAAAIGSGLWGIENKIEPTKPVEGNAYDKTFPEKFSLPQTLTEAAGRLRKSKAAVELFGADFIDHYATTREWEEREFRKAVTDWELARYFEII